MADALYFRTWKDRVIYYFWSTYRRRSLDLLQEQHRHLYQGVVLDIGGRDRGAFRKPKDAVQRWISADISPDHSPDMVLDVADMAAVGSGAIDVVSAIELFEHVDRIESGIRECLRVLRPGGVLILSAPFLYQVHADPYDYQRWTEMRWRQALADAGFQIEELVITGRFFSVWADMAKAFVSSRSSLVRKVLYIFYPLLDLLVKLDGRDFVRRNRVLSSFHGGYFIVCRKLCSPGTRKQDQ
jgi:SAM-dependent methyltransferase